MKRILLFTLLLSAAGCNAQEIKKPKQLSNAETAITRPVENWKVNKQYDDKGNLIGYDSTYTWSYNSNGHIPGNIDSALVSFSKRLQSRIAPFFNWPLNTAALPDKKDRQDEVQALLNDHWENNMLHIKQMLQAADSINRSFSNSFYKTNNLSAPRSSTGQQPAHNIM